MRLQPIAIMLLLFVFQLPNQGCSQYERKGSWDLLHNVEELEGAVPIRGDRVAAPAARARYKGTTVVQAGPVMSDGSFHTGFAGDAVSDGIALAYPAPVEEIKTQDSRKVVYAASLGLRVANLKVAQESIGRIIESRDGFVQRSALQSVIFRVPPAQFEGALDDLEKLGDVTARNVSASDVTEQYVDLELRLDVAESSRQRLKEILEKTGELKDVLEVERDIRRLTEEIETMKGKLRVLQDKIEMTTISVQLEERQPVHPGPSPRRTNSPFHWVRAVGVNHMMSEIRGSAPLHGGKTCWRIFRGAKFRFDLPEGLVPLWSTSKTLIAATPEDYRLKVKRIELRREGDLGFWTKALRDELANRRGYDIKAEEDSPIAADGLAAKELRCSTSYGGASWYYDVWLIQKEPKGKDLLIVEYSRAAKDDASLAEAIEKAVGNAGFRW